MGDYKKGKDFRVYLNTGTLAVQVWEWVEAAVEPTVDPAKADITVNQSGKDTGHFHGKGDPVISFTLSDDAGDANAQTIIGGTMDDSVPIHLAVTRGDMADSGVKYWHLEAVLFSPLATGDDAIASYTIEARRHGNAVNGLESQTTS